MPSVILSPNPIRFVWKCESLPDLPIYSTVGTALDQDAVPNGTLVAFPEEVESLPTGVPIELEGFMPVQAVCYKNGEGYPHRPLTVMKVWYLTRKRSA